MFWAIKYYIFSETGLAVYKISDEWGDFKDIPRDRMYENGELTGGWLDQVPKITI
jgi:hypothetical protein